MMTASIKADLTPKPKTLKVSLKNFKGMSEEEMQEAIDLTLERLAVLEPKLVKNGGFGLLAAQRQEAYYFRKRVTKLIELKKEKYG